MMAFPQWMLQYRLILIGFLLLIALCNSFANVHRPVIGPWFTGPLLAPAGVTVGKGDINVEPYFYGTKTKVKPPIESLSPALNITQGIASRMDLQLYIPYTFNYITTDDRRFSHWEDMFFIVGFQAMRQTAHSYLPSLRIALQELFPTGKFQNLDPERFSSDSTGGGSYQTSIGTNFEETFLLGQHYLNTYLSLIYTVPSAAKVHGFSAYGGGINTRGMVHPGNSLVLDLAYELTLTQHWVSAMDVVYTHTNRSTFHGMAGVNPITGILNQVGIPDSDQVALAPALEYNFNAAVGIVAGVWFSIYEHNANDFVSGVAALNYYHAL